LFGNLVERLKNCGLANGHHNILLARGASWLKSTKGVPQHGGWVSKQHIEYIFFPKEQKFKTVFFKHGKKNLKNQNGMYHVLSLCSLFGRRELRKVR
jgi:hypothetical protein